MELIEREWTDDFGTHYEAKAIGRDGRLHSQAVFKSLSGWPPERARAAENVLRAADRLCKSHTAGGA